MTTDRRLRGGLQEVYDAYRGDRAFDHLRTPHIFLVPGEGASQPNAFIVGEAPGAVDSMAKRPFTGASGTVLRSLITDVARIDPHQYFLTNVIKYRLPNRAAVPAEVAASVPYLRREYAALGAPAVIVAIGTVAYRVFRPSGSGNDGIPSRAGKPQTLSAGRALWPMVDPEMGMQNPNLRSKMEQHWEEFGAWFRREFK